jgi:nicotinamide mononucleotide (NMN) deamidase PncC
MLFRRLSQFLAAAALAIAFVVFAGAAGGSEAKAQGIYRNYYRPNAVIRQRERERFLWHRRQELRREAWRRHYRIAPYRYNYGRYPYHRRW